jgi:ribonuclease HIII
VRDDLEAYEFPEPTVSESFTVKDAISNLPKLQSNDGSEEVIIDNYKTESKYQEWLIGKCTTEDLLQTKKKPEIRNKQITLI